ncbi:aspartic proteinase-like protein 2 isoform X1 [Gossypium australe]|uniref:Aspartic proteinase-like protein 2 isoform X1 n=1 Tax=Gossypium australe TaxID=47621 RepID=A0A5B6ULA6_9ROSI|nr:aspartic proteinase-like protein 2 isoform X1 [Gossypium australe]
MMPRSFCKRREMAAVFPAWIMVTILVLEASLVVGGFQASLKLERRIPLVSHEVELGRLREFDRLRHGRLLQSSGGVVDFPVRGTYDPFLVGLYYTKLQIGSPPKEYYVQIDTGSDVLWIGCNSCNGCPESSGLQIELNLYDPGSSSTSSLVSCSDQRCNAGVQSSDSGCSGQGNQCSYTFQYGDGSGTSGYYVADLLHFSTILEGSMTANSTAPIMFGCSVLQTGDLTKSDRAVDGIFGFGQQSLSVISQLSSQGMAPRVFSHCLRGKNGGGGILVFGEILEPNMVYTPLVPSQPHYNLDLRSISVGGQVLSIDPSVFSTSSSQGTIVDSGTTLAYLADEAYDAFVDAITKTVSQTVRPVLSKGNQCYLITSSVTDIFPQVSLNFAGGASLILNPPDYLVQQNSIGGAAVWCIGFQKIQGQGITILGGIFIEQNESVQFSLSSEYDYLVQDTFVLPIIELDRFCLDLCSADLVLKDKIIVYDLANQRVGWTDYDCSMSVNVSANLNSGRTEFVNAGQMSNDGSSPDQFQSSIASLLNMVMLAALLFS